MKHFIMNSEHLAAVALWLIHLSAHFYILFEDWPAEKVNTVDPEKFILTCILMAVDCGKQSFISASTNFIARIQSELFYVTRTMF